MGRKASGGKGFRHVWPVECYVITLQVGGSPRWEGRKELGVPETNPSNQYFQFQEKSSRSPSRNGGVVKVRPTPMSSLGLVGLIRISG